jgi:hypothetical protein
MRITPSAWRRSANGSLSPVGSWPMPNRPASVSSLSASATTSAGVAARQRVAGKARLVVVLDREGHGVAQAVVARVVAAHDALQLGELADHVGQQVGLGQQRGAVGQVGRPARSPPSCSPMARAMARTRSTRSPWRAQLAVVDHLGQARHARGQRLLAVLVEEELGVGQARAHHALVALDHARWGRPGGCC